MLRSEFHKVHYTDVVNQITNLYGVTAVQEHEFITEFCEGPLPIFKLISVTQDDGTNFLMLSFHIEVEAVIAIQWFVRVRALDPDVRVTACYLRDASGVSHVGEDAHILRLYMIEQDIMSSFIQSDKDPHDVVNESAKVLSTKPSPVKTYADYRNAIDAFNKLEKKKGDLEH